MIVLRGWIVALQSDRPELESLGIILGSFDSQVEEYQDCVVSEEAFKKLDPLWGKYIWGLQVEKRK